MAGGWTKDGAVQGQIDASVEDAVRRARSRLPRGKASRIAWKAAPKFPKRAAAQFPACVFASLVSPGLTSNKPQSVVITGGAVRTAG